MRSALAFAALVVAAGCSHQPPSLRDTTVTLWRWSCGATTCSGEPLLDAGAPACAFAWGTPAEPGRVFLLCGGPLDDAGGWTPDPASCRAVACLHDSDCPDPGGGRVLLCTGGLCEDHDFAASPSAPVEAAALCLADVPRVPPCADAGGDPATVTALAALDGGCAGPCAVPASCRQP